MSRRSLPFPPLQVFQRLQINDGLLMTADLWRRAHNYHRQRQNFIYQSLHHPAVIYGLGVVAIDAPDQLQSTYRDRRWLEIQPGIAIDREGNPIVVPQAQTFHIESEPSSNESLLIYLTISHVDPDKLQPVLDDRTSIDEQFRIVEKTSLSSKDIELCRINLKGEEISITPALDVLYPKANEIDLRHRQAIQTRPNGEIRVAQLTANTRSDRVTTTHLKFLLKAINVLYPRLHGQTDLDLIQTIKPEPISNEEETVPKTSIPDCDLIYAPWRLLQSCTSTTYKQLEQALVGGSMLMVVATLQEVGLDRHSSARDFDTQVQMLVQSLKPIANQINHPLRGEGKLSPLHPLRVEPFLFAQLPVVEGVPLKVWQWGSIVLIIGDVAQNWGPDKTSKRSRESIRTAQEFGINLLMLAWQHRCLTQLQQHDRLPKALSSSPDSLTERLAVSEV